MCTAVSRRCQPTYIDDDEGKLKRGVLPKRATQIMKSWLFQHIAVCFYFIRRPLESCWSSNFSAERSLVSRGINGNNNNNADNF